MKGYLEGLEMDVKACGAEEMDVTPPSFRIDIGREVDLIEEVARMSGFEKIPVTYPRISPLEVGDPPEMILRDEVRSILVGIGFTEIITYSFIAPESADILDADETSDLRSFTRLMNPLGLDQSVLRTSLLPGLMATVRNNRVHGEKDLRLFEWGKIFRDREGEQQPFEQNALAGVIAGHAQQKTWFRDERDVDFYDVKGIVEALLKGLDMDSLHFGKEDVLPGFDKEVSCGVYVSGTCVGHLGKASLKMTSAYDIADENIFIFDLNIGNILPLLGEQTRFRPFPRFPAVYRDISLVVNEDVESGRIVDLIRKTGGKLLESVHIFDIYTGDQIGANEKAIAFRISYRSDQKTLDGESVNRLHERIIRKACDETGGRLREG
jgi:phenylalanyl-tRNA synthetase beta chain